MSRLQFWEGFRISRFERQSGASHLHLLPDVDPIGSACGLPSSSRIHEYRTHLLRALPILSKALIHMFRCSALSACGQRMERVRWLDRYAQLTTRLAKAVALERDNEYSGLAVQPIT